MTLDSHVQANDPYALFPHYRELFSGNQESDKTIYTMAYPSSIYPVLNLGFPIYDNMGDKINPGHYEVALSSDKKFLMLIQSKKLVAKVPVISLEFNEKEYETAYAEYAELKEKLEKYKLKNNRKRIIQYQKEIDYQNKKLLAKNKAEIDNSNADYFLITYRCNFATAIGYIKRASQN